MINKLKKQFTKTRLDGGQGKEQFPNIFKVQKEDKC